MNDLQIQEHIECLYNKDDLPISHKNYLSYIKKNFNFEPKVIYDIGSCVLHWAKEAQNVWPNAKLYLFEAMDAVENLYKKFNYEYHLGVLSDKEKNIIFYESIISPGGNSYYKENSWATDIHYGKNSEKLVKTQTVDNIVSNRNFLPPDLVKIDVQGCELDILRGMTNTLINCKHLIVELQHSQYNTGAPLAEKSIPVIESLGFKLVTSLFCNNGPDGDYHFIKNYE